MSLGILHPESKSLVLKVEKQKPEWNVVRMEKLSRIVTSVAGQGKISCNEHLSDCNASQECSYFMY